MNKEQLIEAFNNLPEDQENSQDYWDLRTYLEDTQDEESL